MDVGRDTMPLLLPCPHQAGQQVTPFGGRLLQRLNALPQRLVGLPAFGDVSGDLGEAPEASIRVAERGDQHVGEEA